MTFLHPEFIYLMLPILFILFFFLLTQGEQMSTFFSDEVLNKLRVQTNRMTLKARNALFLLMFVFIVLALAQPVIEGGKIKVQSKSADIMIALDISDSMLAEDVYPSRLKQAKQKILELLALSPKERLGVMAFAKDAYLVAPLSFDHRAVSFLVKQLKPSYITEKGTDFQHLLFSAGEMMKEKERKYLLIFSDGGDQKDFSKEIAYAKKTGITIFILGIGTEKGAPIKRKEGGFIKHNGAIIVSKLNSAIADLATKSGGSYIESVTSGKDIPAMMKEIGKKSVKRTLEEEEITQFIPLFYYPLAMAMILLLIATSSMSKRERLQMPGAFLVGWLVLYSAPSQAAIMDFRLLEEAKESYSMEDYNRSAELYADYARAHASSEAYYDQANALYQNGQYKDAVKAYEHAHFADKERQFDTLHNLGNAYAKQGEAEALKKAIAAYENALKLKEEKPTRENLERVKELLKEQQQSQQNQDGDKKPEGQDKQKEKKDQEQGQEGQQQEESGDQKQEKDQEGRQSQDDKERQSQKSSNEDKKEDDQQEGNQQTMPPKEEQSKQEEQKKSSKEEEEQMDGNEAEAVQADSEQMSDREEKKWLKILNDQPVSHIYRLEPKEKKEEESNAKPW